MSGLQRGVLWGCSIELITAAVILALVTLSCGVMPVPVGNPPTGAPGVNMKAHIDTSEMAVCKSGGLNVRETPAGKHAGAWLEDGDIVTVKLPATVTEDMGLWYELVDGGWINARYTCDSKNLNK